MDLNLVTSVDWSAVFDCLAVIVGTVTGALFAVAHKLDIVGTISIGLTTAYGGGIIRDILLSSHGFFFMQYPLLIAVCALLAIAIFIFGHSISRHGNVLFCIDALSMSWYALAGAVKSWDAGVGIILTIILGTVTAVGGGALRDIFTGQTPVIFRDSNFYAISAFLGVTIFVMCELFGAPILASSTSCVLVAFVLTLMSKRFNWRTRHR